MRRLVVALVVNAAALAAATWMFRGIRIQEQNTTDRVVTLLVVAAIFGLINTVVTPVVKTLSLPFIFLTLGLLIFVINALMLMLTGWVAGQTGVSFQVDGFWTALGGSIVISIVSIVLGAVLRHD